MKKSIRFKITGTLTISILCIILLCWILNKSFLEEFYEDNKINTIKDTFNMVVGIYQRDDGELSYQGIADLDRLCINQNVSLFVFKDTGQGFLPSYPYYNIENQLDDVRVAVWLYNSIYTDIPVNKNYKQLENTDLYHIVSYYINRVDSDYLHLIGRVTDLTSEDGSSYVISIRTTYQSMKESVIIANKFLAYVGVFVTIVGSVIMFLISRNFTRPILKLAEIAECMSHLNFDAKYTGDSQDEIGLLGNSMNLLSEKLQENISELKTANNELKKDIEKKNELEEMRREFLSNVSHELKTPIALIQGYAEGLSENINDDQESREFYCDVIIDEASKMNRIVQKLLTLNQIEFGNQTVNFERFNLTDVIQSILNSTEILLQQKGVTLIFEETSPLYVWADESMIEEVFTNYLSNALHHVAGKQMIEVKFIRYDNVVRIAVFNTGDNIPEEELDKIWIKFYKVDKARSREYGGSGVGLSIVKAIMETLNQKYGVINRPTGVEFWFELDVQ